MKKTVIAVALLLISQTASAQLGKGRSISAQGLRTSGDNLLLQASTRGAYKSIPEDSDKTCLEERATGKTFCQTPGQWRAIARRIENGQPWHP